MADGAVGSHIRTASWSILVPEALLGVGSVALLWATIRRYFGGAAGLIAGLALATTPVAVLMFKFNNPDALLVLLMIAAVWAMLRAVETARLNYLILCGVFVGFGFLTKQLQVMLVVPPLAMAYFFFGPPKLGKRIVHLVVAGAAMVASAGWWVVAVTLWPASDRPYIGGSQTNSILELTFGYNGLGRLTGNEKGSVGGGGAGRVADLQNVQAQQFGGGRGGMGWGQTGISRMFESAQGGQIAWLIPAAMLLLVVGVVLRGRAPRTDVRRAALVLFGAWLVVTALVFSFMAGIFHPYYTVALAPAIAALVGAGSVVAWESRQLIWVRISLAVTVLATAATSWILLSRSADFVPWLQLGRRTGRRGRGCRGDHRDASGAHRGGVRIRRGRLRWPGRVCRGHSGDAAQQCHPVGGTAGGRRNGWTGRIRTSRWRCDCAARRERSAA